MLPRITISPDISRPSLRSATSSRPSSANELRSKKAIRPPPVCGTSRPSAAASLQLGSVTPTRRSLDGLKAVEASLQDLALQSSIYSSSAGNGGSSSSSGGGDVQSAANSAEVNDNCQLSSSSKASLTSSTSSCSLTSDAELALLLGGAEVAAPAGTTVINVGSIPLFVPVSCVDVEKVTGAEGLELASQENLLLADPPPGHLQLFEQDCLAETASGAQPALRTASSINTSTTKLKATSAEFYPKAYLAAAAAAAAATALAAASASTNGSSQQQQQHQSMADHHSLATAEDLDHGAPGGGWRPADDQHQSPAHQLCQADVTSEQQQQPGYLQHWRHWPQLQQITAVPVFFPVPVPVQPLMAPLTLMMYPYSYHQHQHLPPAPEQQYMHASAPLPGEDQQHPAVGPAAAAAPADMPPGRAAAGIGVAVLDDLATSSSPSVTHQASSLLDSSSGRYIAGSSRPGSSASSMASGYSSFRGSSGSGWQQQQQQTVLREASSTVSVSPLSNVKDAAGALAKVASRHGSCLLLAVARAGDQVAQVTHVAAKSLAVARFYLNSGMSAEGAAGVEAAAHLTGVEPAAAAVAPAAAVQDELIFMPYYKSGCNAAQGSSNEPVIHFLVAKAAAVDLPAQLPPPVGIPACMQDRQQQPGAAATAAASSSSSSQLLRAGAGTDVNKLSNAIIHNILDQGHVALQLAGATACLIAMKALVKAGSRLQKKFSSDIVATASFANLDTSSSIGRSTVFLRVDVMRSSLLRQLAVAGAAAGDALSRQVSAALEVVVGCSPHQHQQPLVAC